MVTTADTTSKPMTPARVKAAAKTLTRWYLPMLAGEGEVCRQGVDIAEHLATHLDGLGDAYARIAEAGYGIETPIPDAVAALVEAIEDGAK